ncbi:MAG: YraN family protein [Bacteroidetes bacterium]|nr:YraN family protein [Bacteroidota bacterium]
MAEHNQTGTKGEDIAASYLEKQGYALLEKNWRFGHEEIDIIASNDSTLVIAEVKTRKSNHFGEPEEFVTRQKQKHLIKAANAYIEKKDLDLEVRFDIISILLSGSEQKIIHIEDAFHPIA